VGAKDLPASFKSAGSGAKAQAQADEIVEVQEALRALGLAVRFEVQGEPRWAPTGRAR
jgi:hypothetical protein